MPTHHPHRFALLGLMTLAGCNVIGALTYKAAGEKEIPPEHVLEKRPTIILVENFVNPDLAADDAQLLARQIERHLREKDAAPIIAVEELLAYKNGHLKTFGKMTVKQIGEAMGAQQVIYVSLEGGGVASMGGGSTLQGKASALVKVIDVRTGQTLWPAELTDGRQVSYETDPTSGNTRPESVRQLLYAGLARNAARLFTGWKPEDSSEIETLKD